MWIALTFIDTKSSRKWTTTFSDYCKAEKVILSCTDDSARCLDSCGMWFFLIFFLKESELDTLYLYKLRSNIKFLTFYHMCGCVKADSSHVKMIFSDSRWCWKSSDKVGEWKLRMQAVIGISLFTELWSSYRILKVGRLMRDYHFIIATVGNF